LDLIDRMLAVSVDNRITVDECLEHPWITQQPISVTDSTDGLTGALAGLDFSKRKPVRERTLLSSINDVKVERVIETPTEGAPVKVFDKNASQQHFVTNSQQAGNSKRPMGNAKGHVEHTIEPGPAHARDTMEFVEMGGKGDELLFDETGENESLYPDATNVRAGAPQESNYA
jgi:serine/threonine-protein kinase Chk2